MYNVKELNTAHTSYWAKSEEIIQGEKLTELEVFESFIAWYKVCHYDKG